MLKNTDSFLTHNTLYINTYHPTIHTQDTLPSQKNFVDKKNLRTFATCFARKSQQKKELGSSSWPRT